MRRAVPKARQHIDHARPRPTPDLRTAVGPPGSALSRQARPAATSRPRWRAEISRWSRRDRVAALGRGGSPGIAELAAAGYTATARPLDDHWWATAQLIDARPRPAS
jgi:hypothetical protein